MHVAHNHSSVHTPACTFLLPAPSRRLRLSHSRRCSYALLPFAARILTISCSGVQVHNVLVQLPDHCTRSQNRAAFGCLAGATLVGIAAHLLALAHAEPRLVPMLAAHAPDTQASVGSMSAAARLSTGAMAAAVALMLAQKVAITGKPPVCCAWMRSKWARRKLEHSCRAISVRR